MSLLKPRHNGWQTIVHLQPAPNAGGNRRASWKSSARLVQRTALEDGTQENGPGASYPPPPPTLNPVGYPAGPHPPLRAPPPAGAQLAEGRRGDPQSRGSMCDSAGGAEGAAPAGGTTGHGREPRPPPAPRRCGRRTRAAASRTREAPAGGPRLSSTSLPRRQQAAPA